MKICNKIVSGECKVLGCLSATPSERDGYEIHGCGKFKDAVCVDYIDKDALIKQLKEENSDLRAKLSLSIKA